MWRQRLILGTLALVLAAPFSYRLVERLQIDEQPLDAGMARAGKELFNHEWTPGDPLAGGGDGLGPVFNANSCVACHRQGGTGGSGSAANNVTVFTVRPSAADCTVGAQARQGVVHSQAVSPDSQEMLGHVHPGLPLVAVNPTPGHSHPTQGLRVMSLPPGVDLSQRKTPALFGAGLIDAIPDRDIIANERTQRLKWGLATSQKKGVPVGRALRMADGRIGRFGWKAQTVRLAEFVRAACANELGLGNPGQAQPRPLGNPGYPFVGHDLTLAQCDQLTEFIKSLPPPVERMPLDSVVLRRSAAGKALFQKIGCAECHVPDVGPARGLYSDLLLHDMGQELEAGGDYNDQPLDDPAFDAGTGPLPAEWRTPPLWGVACSAPYLHDGRAATLDEAIQMHGGQGLNSARKFAALTVDERSQVRTFLMTLDAP